MAFGRILGRRTSSIDEGPLNSPGRNQLGMFSFLSSSPSRTTPTQLERIIDEEAKMGDRAFMRILVCQDTGDKPKMPLYDSIHEGQASPISRESREFGMASHQTHRGSSQPAASRSGFGTSWTDSASHAQHGRLSQVPLLQEMDSTRSYASGQSNRTIRRRVSANNTDLLGEMMFGSSSAIAAKSVVTKTHHLTTPQPQIMLTKLFSLAADADDDDDDVDYPHAHRPRSSSSSSVFSENSESTNSIGDLRPPNSAYGSYSRSYTPSSSYQHRHWLASSDFSPMGSPSQSSSPLLPDSYGYRRKKAQRFSLNQNSSYADEHLLGRSSSGLKRRPRKRHSYALGVIFNIDVLPELKDIYFTHFAIIDRHVQHFQRRVSKAIVSALEGLVRSSNARDPDYLVYSRGPLPYHFLNADRSFCEEAEKLRIALLNLAVFPRIDPPLWLNMLTFPQTRTSGCESLVSDLCFLTGKHNPRHKQLFMSSLVTLVLSLHLAWTGTVASVIRRESAADPKANDKDSDPRDSEDDLSQPYNIYMAQLSDLHGSIGAPAIASRTLIVGENNKDAVRRILNVLSYFIRSGELVERIQVAEVPVPPPAVPAPAPAPAPAPEDGAAASTKVTAVSTKPMPITAAGPGGEAAPASLSTVSQSTDRTPKAHTQSSDEELSPVTPSSSASADTAFLKSTPVSSSLSGVHRPLHSHSSQSPSSLTHLLDNTKAKGEPAAGLESEPGPGPGPGPEKVNEHDGTAELPPGSISVEAGNSPAQHFPGFSQYPLPSTKVIRVIPDSSKFEEPGLKMSLLSPSRSLLGGYGSSYYSGCDFVLMGVRNIQHNIMDIKADLWQDCEYFDAACAIIANTDTWDCEVMECVSANSTITIPATISTKAPNNTASYWASNGIQATFSRNYMTATTARSGMASGTMASSGLPTAMPSSGSTLSNLSHLQADSLPDDPDDRENEDKPLYTVSGSKSSASLVDNMIKTLNGLWNHGMPAETCVMFIEDQLQEFYNKAVLLSLALQKSSLIDFVQLASMLRVELSDLPLLISIASTFDETVSMKLGSNRIAAAALASQRSAMTFRMYT
ncbi:folliculin-interacting protein middle domain-containing protein [Polychytrium aggregatum]|uniref:folliculin-interacting protein middle domain-containing protein n=1 Tax=Polychytrium aggregatum TaxID=110093 RepID=UPI0022FECDC1|nr:folliculin-interacting protein middle domain-containing protein [Polychytrium aggregatum]KAI9199220.1 folliculin-interacting protein middle domain-containing protein [Polychytrium aggregatum]